MTLTSHSGRTVSVLATPQTAEFMHLNGTVAPMLTATVPQDTYVSARLTVTDATVTCITLNSYGGLLSSEFGTAVGNAVVNVPAPLAINGPTAQLVLTLLAPQSAIFSSCGGMYLPPGGASPSTTITPTFTLGAASLDPHAAGYGPARSANLAGLVSSVDASANQVRVLSEDGLSWTVATSGSTLFEGVPALAALAAGMPVILDMDVNPDGSLVATRVAVPDADPASVSTFHGPVAFVDAASPTLVLGPTMTAGAFSTAATSGTLPTTITSAWTFDASTAVYQTSSGLTNLSRLPFTARFDATNIVPGQSVIVSNHQLYWTAANRDPAATITLVPQTINGTVSGATPAGGFTSYTVALAPYDVFAALAVQQGQATTLKNPASVVVYVDANTVMRNTVPIAPGSALRFVGLVFNDNGTLRMDCSEILDGVPL